MPRFDWDPAKSEANLRKHGITFEEAETAAEHALAISVPDRVVAGEIRVRTTGWSKQGRLLVVITSEGGPRPRIISARRATKRERHGYEHGRRPRDP